MTVNLQTVCYQISNPFQLVICFILEKQRKELELMLHINLKNILSYYQWEVDKKKKLNYTRCPHSDGQIPIVEILFYRTKALGFNMTL